MELQVTMNICIATAAYCVILNAVAYGYEIEPGFPTDCGVPDFPRENKKEAERMKVPATPHSWPWQVGLWSQVLGAFPFCGGTLISNSLIVTAGHCLQTYFKCTRFPVGIDIFLSEERSKALQILVGGHDFTSYDGYDQFFTVQRAIVHPDYNQDAILHSTDLVILQIDGQITFNAAVKPICFPSMRVKLPPGSICYYTGWGRIYADLSQGRFVLPRLLNEAQVKLDFDETCMLEYPHFNSDRSSCIKTEGTCPCFGDSGGGIFCPSENENSWFWYGAICSGSVDCLANWAIISNISTVHSWIRDMAFFLGL